MSDASAPPTDAPPIDLVTRIGGVPENYEEIAAGQRALIQAVLPPGWDPRGKTILDFGCGVGRTLTAFWDVREEITAYGCDIDRASIDWANEHLNPPFTFVACDEVPPLALPDRTFDLVYAMSVFTHITDHWADWIVELHRVLKPGGVLVASILNEPMSQFAFERPWDERTGMLCGALGRPWSIGGPNVALSEWWVREHWGRALEIDHFQAGVQTPDGLAGHGLVVARRRDDDAQPTIEQLTAIDFSDVREQQALLYSLEALQAEARKHGEESHAALAEVARLQSASGAQPAAS
jgi:SAM-dependent methyltransferase